MFTFTYTVLLWDEDVQIGFCRKFTNQLVPRRGDTLKFNGCSLTVSEVAHDHDTKNDAGQVEIFTEVVCYISEKQHSHFSRSPEWEQRLSK